MGNTKERARSVLGLLTSLGLVAPAATGAGCTTTSGGMDARALPDHGPVGTENPPFPFDAGMDAPVDAEGPRWDVPTIENVFPWDDGDAPTEDAPTDDDAPADDDAAG